jgi:ribonuclease BN (tRNA processing enzyme)
MITRSEIYAKYGGCCAYCGREISLKNFHVDHLVPIYRGTRGWQERDKAAIKMPACARCNRWKSVHSLEQFRAEIGAQVDRVRRDSAGFRLAEDFGLILGSYYPVEFFFESQVPTAHPEEV